MMKRLIFLSTSFFLFLLPFSVYCQVSVDETHFPDPVFREYVRTNFDTDADGSLSEGECQAVTVIYVGYLDAVSSLKGIEYFPFLSVLDCDLSCPEMTSLDVSQNPALTSLDCRSTKITSLDVSQNPALRELDCSSTLLTSLDLSQNPVLRILTCTGTPLTSLDLSKNTALEHLECIGVGFESLDLSKNTALTYLDCSGCELLASLDLSKNTALEHLECRGMGFESLDLSENKALKYLGCQRAHFTSLDLKQNTALEELDCSIMTDLTALDLTHNASLVKLDCWETSLKSLDLSQNTKLEELNCYSTPLKSLNLDNNVALRNLSCDMTSLAGLNLDKNTRLEYFNGSGWCVGVKVDGNGVADLSSVPGLDLARTVEWTGGTLEGAKLTFGDRNLVKYKYLTGYTGDYPGMDTVEVSLVGIAQDLLEISPVNFPDEVFRNYVSQHFDRDGNGGLDVEEIAAARVLGGDESFDELGNVVSLQGIEHFSALNILSAYVGKITSLDVSRNLMLQGLMLYMIEPDSDSQEMEGDGLCSLDLSQNWELQSLGYIGTGNLKQLDLSHNPKLRELAVGSTTLTSLDLSHNPELAFLSVYYTALTSLDLSANQKLMNVSWENARREVKAEVGGTYDLSRLSGFDVSRASEWKGGSVQGNILTFQDTAVTYQYETRYAGEGEEIPSSLEFKLVANPDAEEDVASSVSMQAVPFLAYAREGVLYLQGTQGTVEVFNLQGVCLYRGNKTSVKLPSQGVYLVRNQGYTRKVLNLM